MWIGASVTVLLFNLGRILIGLYIGRSGVASGFGAAGSLIVVFLWVYYSAQIFLMGEEFTWVYAKTFGSMKEQTDGQPDALLDAQPAAPAAVPDRRAGARLLNKPPTANDGRAGVAGQRPNAAQPVTSIAMFLVMGLSLRRVVPRLVRRLR